MADVVWYTHAAFKVLKRGEFNYKYIAAKIMLVSRLTFIFRRKE